MRKFIQSFVIMLSIAIMFSLTGCDAIMSKVANAAKDKIEDEIKNSKDKDEDEDEEETTKDDEDEDDEDETTTAKDDEDDDNTAITTSDGKSLEWPADKMGNIPNIFPKISFVMDLDGSVIVTFEGLEKDDAEAYVEDLKELGFTEGGAEFTDDAGLMYSKNDKDGNNVTFTYINDGTGSVTYVLAKD